MARFAWPLDCYHWLRKRVDEYQLGDRLWMDPGELERAKVYLGFDPDDSKAKSAARDIASSYAHELARTPSYCFDCKKLVSRGDACRAVEG